MGAVKMHVVYDNEGKPYAAFAEESRALTWASSREPREAFVVPVDELDAIIAEKLKAFSERVSDRLLAKRDQEDSRLRGHHTGMAFEKAAAIVRQEADNG